MKRERTWSEMSVHAPSFSWSAHKQHETEERLSLDLNLDPEFLMMKLEERVLQNKK